MHHLPGSALAATLLLLASSNSWSAPANGFTYWGVGLEAQELGIDVRVEAPADGDSEAVNTAGGNYAYAFGTRFFAGYQFNNGFTLEAGAFGGATPEETINSELEIARRSEFSIDAKAAYTFALSDYAFARAHVGTRFYTRQAFAAAPTNEDSGWTLTQTKLASSDLTAGLGMGFSWGSARVVLMEYQALQREEQALHSFSLSLMIRI